MKILQFTSFKIYKHTIRFEYKFNHKTYYYILKLQAKHSLDKNDKALQNIVFHIGIANCVSLWSLDDFDKISITPFKLSNAQEEFFSEHFLKGLAEFRYRNNLSLDKEIKVVSNPSAKRIISMKLGTQPNSLILNGGGKDGAIAAEISKTVFNKNYSFSLNKSKSRYSMFKLNNLDEYIHFKRIKDSQLTKDQKYTGHKPLSILILFHSLLAAYLTKTKYIVAGNEYSANFGNLLVDNFQVNHQYSKSFEFELSVNEYVKKHIALDLEYFSILRQLYELQIAKIFSEYKKYHTTFISCNIGQKKGFWCGKCAKCAFIFLILYPFLKQEELNIIFGKNLFKDVQISKHIINMLKENQKPFECVGTAEEVSLAILLSLQKNPLLVLGSRVTHEEILHLSTQSNLSKLEKKILKEYKKRENNIPNEISKKVEEYFNNNL